jgi:hypothetical protein
MPGAFTNYAKVVAQCGAPAHPLSRGERVRVSDKLVQHPCHPGVQPNATERNRTISGYGVGARREGPSAGPTFRAFRVFRGHPKSNKTERFQNRSVLDHAVPMTYDDASSGRSILEGQSEGRVTRVPFYESDQK